MSEGRWIRFTELKLEDKRVTKKWSVTSLDGFNLGYIQWYAPWRQYAFMPLASTVFERQCLRDIADFCYHKSREHRQKRRESLGARLLEKEKEE
jgi:hypothetical protein